MRFPSQLKSTRLWESAIPPLLVVWVGSVYGVCASQSLNGLARPAGFCLVAIVFWGVVSLLQRPHLHYVAVPLTFICSQPQLRTWTYRPWDAQWDGFVAAFQRSFFDSLLWFAVLGAIAFCLLAAPGAIRASYRFACSPTQNRR